MACLLAPGAAAIIVTAAKKKFPDAYHVEWLLLMLWGGFIMLMVDHVAQGEIVPYFPFFTKSWHEIWPEIISIGIPMTIAIFMTWTAMVWVASRQLRSKEVKNK